MVEGNGWTPRHPRGGENCPLRILGRRSSGSRALYLRFHSLNVFVDAGEPVAPIPAASWNIAVRDVGTVNLAGAVCHLSNLPWKEAREQYLASFELSYARAVLTRCDGNISAAAREAGVDRKTFYALLRRDRDPQAGE